MNNLLSPSPAVETYSLTLAADVFAQWQAGKVVVLNKDGVTVDGEKWEHLGVKPISNPIRPGHKYVFRFEGEICIITFDGKEVCVPALKGLHYIHYLIQHPWEDVHTSELVAKFNGEAPTYGDGETEEAIMNNTLSIETERREKVLTPDQRKTVEMRLSELKQELVDLKQIDAPTDELELEIEKFEAYLNKVGFGKRAAKFSNQCDLDRNSVTKAIKFAIKTIDAKHPTLGQFLTKSFKFGEFVLYKPTAPIQWME